MSDLIIRVSKYSIDKCIFSTYSARPHSTEGYDHFTTELNWKALL